MVHIRLGSGLAKLSQEKNFFLPGKKKKAFSEMMKNLLNFGERKNYQSSIYKRKTCLEQKDIDSNRKTKINRSCGLAVKAPVEQTGDP